MAASASRVSVGATPTALNGVDVGGNPGSGIYLKNMGAETLFVGGATVTTTDGFPVDAGTEIGMDFESAADILYGVVETGPVEVAVLRVGA